MKSFNLEIVTLDGSPFSGKAERVLVRTTEGDVEIMAGHTEYLATIDAGRIKITAPEVFDKEKYPKGYRLGAVSGGFISVRSDIVKIVVTTFEYSDEIDLNRALAAKEKAEKAMRNSTDVKEMNLAKAKLMRALTRINVEKEN